MQIRTLIVVVGLSFALYLATKEPAVGAIIPFVYSGRKSIRAGLWLRREDPIRQRGKICAASYLALGCWNSAAAALASLLGFMAIGGIAGRELDDPRFIITMIVLMIGGCLNCLVGTYASLSAWRSGFKIWAHPNIVKWAEGDFQNLTDLRFSRPQINHAMFVVGTALAMPALILATIVLVVVSTGPWKDSEEVAIGTLIGGFLVLQVLLIIGYGLLSDRILARTPSECWGHADAAV